MKITFSVFPPRAALRNEAESSDCKIEQIRNGLSTILFSLCHVIISTWDFLFCTLAFLFSACWPLPLLYLCCHTHGYRSNIAFTAFWGLCPMLLFNIISVFGRHSAQYSACDAYNVFVCLDDEPHCEGLAQPLSRVHWCSHMLSAQSPLKGEETCDKCEYIQKGLVTDKQEPIARCTHCEKWPWAQNEKETKRDEGFSGKRQLSNPDFPSKPRSGHKVDMFHLHFILSFTINPVIWSDQSSSLPIYVCDVK